MPQYFPKMKKLTSLQRQFNLYGFQRLTRDGPDAGAYYHEAFLRHRPCLSVHRMNRRRIKGTGYKASSNPDAEPNLYALPFVRRKPGNCGIGQQEVVAPVQSNPYLPQSSKVTESSMSSYSSSSTSSSGDDSVSTSPMSSSWHPSSNNEVRSSSIPKIAGSVPSYNNDPSLAARRPSTTYAMPDLDQFLTMADAEQDSLLEDIFSTDVSPLQALPDRATRRSSAEDPSILKEFVDFWGRASGLLE